MGDTSPRHEAVVRLLLFMSGAGESPPPKPRSRWEVSRTVGELAGRLSLCFGLEGDAPQGWIQYGPVFGATPAGGEARPPRRGSQS